MKAAAISPVFTVRRVHDYLSELHQDRRKVASYACIGAYSRAMHHKIACEQAGRYVPERYRYVSSSSGRLFD